MMNFSIDSDQFHENFRFHQRKSELCSKIVHFQHTLNILPHARALKFEIPNFRLVLFKMSIVQIWQL